MADLRAEVATLALEAAGKVIGESMDDNRQRRLVEEFLREETVGVSADSKS
jgi:F0F1-type ATP synthase membrane subunit b/b'